MGTPAEATYTSGFIRLTRTQFIGTLAGLMMCLLLAALDQTIVGTAEPRIIASLSGFDRYPWVATTYLLTSTICMPIFAKLSDMYGRKGFFLLGAIVFVASSALCGGAGEMSFFPFDGMGQLIVFRGFQGLGGGIDFWTDARRLADRQSLLALVLLGESPGRCHRHRRDLAGVPCVSPAG